MTDALIYLAPPFGIGAVHAATPGQARPSLLLILSAAREAGAMRLNFITNVSARRVRWTGDYLTRYS